MAPTTRLEMNSFGFSLHGRIGARTAVSSFGIEFEPFDLGLGASIQHSESSGNFQGPVLRTKRNPSGRIQQGVTVHTKQGVMVGIPSYPLDNAKVSLRETVDAHAFDGSLILLGTGVRGHYHPVRTTTDISCEFPGGADAMEAQIGPTVVRVLKT